MGRNLAPTPVDPSRPFQNPELPVIVLGAVLLVVAALVTLGTIFTNSTPAPDASIFGVSLSNVSVGGLFLAGVVVGVIGMLGLSLMLGGGARKRQKTVTRKREVKHVRGQADSLEQENTRLREELAGGERPAVVRDDGGQRRS